MGFTRSLTNLVLTATVSYGQYLFSAVSSGIDSVGASAFRSQYNAYANSVVNDPRWTSATAALQTQAVGVAIVFSTNPLLMANDLFTATVTPSWYPLIKPDLQSYVYSLASVEAGLYVDDKSIADGGGTTFPAFTAVATSSSPTTLSTVPVPATTVYLQAPGTSSPQPDGLSSGAKIGIGVGAGVGGLVIIGLIAFGIILCHRKRRRARYSMSQGTTAVSSRPMTYASLPQEPSLNSPKPYHHDSKVELHGASLPPEMGAGKFGPAYELSVQHAEQRPYELASQP